MEFPGKFRRREPAAGRKCQTRLPTRPPRFMPPRRMSATKDASMKFSLVKFGLALAAILASSSCRKKEVPVERGDTPPPVESIQPGRCAQGGGTVADPASAAFFPRKVSDYCIDPNSETRAYGKNAPGTLDQVCTELFDGECEVYRMFGLERVVTVRYADGKGTTSSVNVVLSRFESVRGAYGFYTKRVVADADPVDTKTKPLAVGGVGALASTIAYVWRGLYVAELSYVNDSESPDALRQSAAAILPELAKSIGDAVTGDTQLPDTASLLPSTDRIPMGIVYEPRDVLGIQGVGPGAYGFYAADGRRYRLAILERSDEASAQDVMKTLKKIPGASESKAGLSVISLPWHGSSEATKTEWLFARQGKVIVGIGDEELVLAQLTPAQAKSKCLPREQKLERLKAVLESIRNRPDTANPSGAAAQPGSLAPASKKE